MYPLESKIWMEKLAEASPDPLESALSLCGKLKAGSLLDRTRLFCVFLYSYRSGRKEPYDDGFRFNAYRTTQLRMAYSMWRFHGLTHRPESENDHD